MTFCDFSSCDIVGKIERYYSVFPIIKRMCSLELCPF